MKKILVCFIAVLLFNNYANAAHKKHHHVKKHLHHKTNGGPRINNVRATPSLASVSKKVPSTISGEQLDADAIANQPKLYSYSALALNANTNKVIVRKNPSVQLPIASITKLMTAMVLLDANADMDDYVTIASEDVDTLRNTFSRLKVGMQLRRRDLLLLALMSSENRAAHALARTAYTGGTPAFIRKMNQKAQTLGMTNTTFYDPTGLTNANRSTAEDLSKMVAAAFNYDLIREDTTTKNANVMLSRNYIHKYINSDALVRGGNFQIELSKTGFINEAGHCLVLYSIIDKEPIIMVFLNSSGKSGRLVDALAVRNYVRSIS